jgi:hypothetical protein
MVQDMISIARSAQSLLFGYTLYIEKTTGAATPVAAQRPRKGGSEKGQASANAPPTFCSGAVLRIKGDDGQHQRRKLDCNGDCLKRRQPFLTPFGQGVSRP